jgi:hypothetical protein
MPEQRTPAPTPRATITVAELPAELGRDLRGMYHLCNAQQVYADGPNCPIGPNNADHLREAHADRERRMERLREIEREGDFSRQYVRAKLGALGDPFNDRDTLTVARNMGVRAHHHKRPKKSVEPPLTGTAAVAAQQWPSITRDDAQRIALTWTGHHGFTDIEAAAWWSAGGLRANEAPVASLLREHGIRPEHMRERVRGETIRDRLNDGMAVEHLVPVLRDAGRL